MRKTLESIRDWLRRESKNGYHPDELMSTLSTLADQADQALLKTCQNCEVDLEEIQNHLAKNLIGDDHEISSLLLRQLFSDHVNLRSEVSRIVGDDDEGWGGPFGH